MRLAAKRRTVPEAEGPRVPAADWLVLALVISQVFGNAKDPFLPVLFSIAMGSHERNPHAIRSSGSCRAGILSGFI